MYILISIPSCSNIPINTKHQLYYKDIHVQVFIVFNNSAILLMSTKEQLVNLANKLNFNKLVYYCN